MEFEDLYYLVEQDYNFEDYAVYPSESSSVYDYDYEEVLWGNKALRFNTELDDIESLTEKYIFLFDGPSFVVNTELKDKIDFGLYGAKFFPAVLCDEGNRQREEFWILNTYKTLDVLDEKDSELKTLPSDSRSDALFLPNMVIKYSFNSDLLRTILEEERLIFKISNTGTDPIFVHEKVVQVFNNLKVKGVKFYKVSEFQEGDQHFSL